MYNRILFSKKKEVLILATTWINLENIMLREESQTQKKLNEVRFHVYEITRIGRSIETKSRLV